MSYFSNFSNSEFSYNIKERGFNSTNFAQSTFNNTNNFKPVDFDFNKFKYDISFKKYPENIDLYNSFLRRGYRKYANSISQFYFQILPEENFIKAENNYLKKRIDELTNLLRERDKIINQMNNNKLNINNQTLNSFYNTLTNKNENTLNKIEIENQTLKRENENLKHNINLLTNKITNMKSQKPSYFIGYSDAENIINNENYNNYKINKIDIYKRTNEIFNSNKNWDNIITPVNTNKRLLYNNNENNKINLNEINTPSKNNNNNNNIKSYNNNYQINNNNINTQPLLTFGNNLKNKVEIQTLNEKNIKSNDIISSINNNSKPKINNRKLHENIKSFDNDLRITNLMFTDLLKDVKERLRSHSCNPNFNYIQDDNLNSLKIKKVNKNNILKYEKRSVSTNNIFKEKNS